jgi:hypothetical protein
MPQNFVARGLLGTAFMLRQSRPKETGLRRSKFSAWSKVRLAWWVGKKVGSVVALPWLSKPVWHLLKVKRSGRYERQ